MPTREEKVAHIETALRCRFFPIVPKILKADRNGWTEDQHDTDRRSRSLAACALVKHCGIDDATAVAAITDGSNDGGIDALYFDRGNNRLVLIQSKFKRIGTAPSQDEVLKTINGVRALQARQFNKFNEAVQNRLDDIEVALDTPGVKLHLLFAFLGETVSPHAADDLNGFCAELNKSEQRAIWQVEGADLIHEWLVAEQTPKTVDDRIVLFNWASATTPHRVFYGQMLAKDLARLVQKHGVALFERNIRHYLGSVGVNTAIERTVRSKPGEFFYLNNGITAVAKTIEQAAGSPDRCAFGVKCLSIVNGAQTAGAITNAALSKEISADARILITIIDIGDDFDDLGIKVTRARNYQTVVRGVDFAALDPNQERLRRELAAVGISYYYRPSAESQVRRDDALTLEEAALALTCLAFKVQSSTNHARLPQVQNAINLVVIAKGEIGRLWEQEGEVYRQLFPNELSGIRMYRLVQIYRFIDRILAETEKSENTYERRTFFRHARYFIMAFVASRSEQVVVQPRLTLSKDEQSDLSRCVNELSELIYAASESFQSVKGYLAIFRSLTHAQQLADDVLRRLAEQDRQQITAQKSLTSGSQTD